MYERKHKMKILMVGGGGREHALIKKLKESRYVPEVICAPGNGGISCDARCFDVSADDKAGMIKLAKNECVDLVFVAPDNPLADGLVDELEAEGIRAFGPSKAAAQIEASKVFAKNLMKKYNIPTAGYEVFDNANSALKYIKEKNEFPTVIKADGLAFGKGVIIAQSISEAETAISSLMEDKIFGESGSRIVIEQYITGPEVSVLAFCDGKTVKPMVSSMDFKRVFDGNIGPNTGGMGNISPNPYYTDEIADICMKKIFAPTVKAMAEEGNPFKGCLYFGLMLTSDGPKVIEYNSRFGDPETQVVMPLLKTDLVDIINAVIDEKLDKINIEWENGAAACVILASGGYPGKFEKGMIIKGLNKVGEAEGVTVYHAGTKLSSGRFLTSSGRVLGITATAPTVEKALEIVYDHIGKISFNGMHFRTDIGKC